MLIFTVCAQKPTVYPVVIVMLSACYLLATMLERMNVSTGRHYKPDRQWAYRYAPGVLASVQHNGAVKSAPGHAAANSSGYTISAERSTSASRRY